MRGRELGVWKGAGFTELPLLLPLSKLSVTVLLTYAPNTVLGLNGVVEHILAC